MKTTGAGYLRQQEYEVGDPLPCCSCEYRRGEPDEACECRCHDIARQVYRMRKIVRKTELKVVEPEAKVVEPEVSETQVSWAPPVVSDDAGSTD